MFRGHADITWTLLPSVGRGPYVAKSRETYEAALFKIFRREAYGYLAATPADDWEWLASAQHHGLPTRLLDWTHNPWRRSISRWPDANADGQIFALRALVSESEQRPASPFGCDSPVKYYPNIVTPRIRAQEGLFIACAKLETPLDRTLRNNWRIEGFKVPKVSEPRLRYQLFRMGIHASSLFPDVDGLVERIKWQLGVASPFQAAEKMAAKAGART